MVRQSRSITGRRAAREGGPSQSGKNTFLTACASFSSFNEALKTYDLNGAERRFVLDFIETHGRFALRQAVGLPVEKEILPLFNCVDYITCLPRQNFLRRSRDQFIQPFQIVFHQAFSDS